MNVLPRFAASVVIVLAAVSGCAAQGGSPPASADGCAAFAVTAIQRHAIVSRTPDSCHGLGPVALGQAIQIAVSRLSLSHDKAVRRHRVDVARSHLGYLISAERRSAARHAAAAAARLRSQSSRRNGTQARAASQARGISVPAGLAALVAWLLTVASGAYLLASWLKPARRRAVPGAGAAARPRRMPPPVIQAHLGLAVAGLAVWSGYLLTRWAALAWTALCLLLPVVGLGISTLMLAIPDPASGSAPRSPAGPQVHGVQQSGAVAVAELRAAAIEAPSAEHAGTPVLVIVLHGALATLTVLLALLGAVAAIAAR